MSECKQHHWPSEEGECPYCEIDRLQAIIAEDSDLSISEWHSDRAELLKHVGELMDENTQLKQGYTAIRNDMSRVSKAAKEVEQENRDINQQMDRLCDDNVKLNDEYDELQKMFTAAAAHAEELELGAEELNNQIEDLEKYKERAAEIFVEKDKRIIAIWEEHGYKITTEQIRAAVEVTLKPPVAPMFSGRYRRGAWDALEKLGIVRCEGCGGSGKTRPLSRPKDAPPVTCPDCNGEGWVIKDE